MKTDYFVWQKKPGRNWVRATMPLTRADALSWAAMARVAYITRARWRVSKEMPSA